MSRYDLLPPNATQLERDLSRATSSLQRAGAAVPIIRTAKRLDIPDSVVPWLIYEYGLGEILPYLGSNQRRALEEGVLWQRIRGTPEAVRIALSWIDIEGLIEESEGGTARWAEYQLGLSAATQGEQIIDDIVGVTRISSPVRSRLQRIYSVYDFRRFVLDDSLLSDGGMLSDHSGVRPRPDWPQISYGQIVSSLVLENATVASTHTDVIGVLAKNFDRFQLDHSLLDEEWHTINHPSLLTNLEGVSARYEGQTWTSITWQDQAWGDVNAVASSGVQATYNGVFALEDGGLMLAEDGRVLAREDY
jgi:P2-related tail formation protein